MQRFHDRIWWLLALAGLLPAGIAHANDSSAGLDGGQLVLKQADNIRMESEELFLSMKEVRIRYEFRNTGTKDVETIVAFPLPPMPAKADVDEGIMENVTYDPSSDNPLDFACRVDDQAVKTKTERKDVKGKEGKDKDKNGGTTLTYYWTQKFPAGRTIVVEHTYKPALWQSFAPKPTPEDATRYCIDAAAKKSIDGIARTDQVKVYFSNGLNYILKTARNWSGPIGDFHLTIDKGDAKNVVSLCMDGIKKTGPTRYEFRKKDFVPDRDLSVLFVTSRERTPGQSPSK
jgi:Domain of unknown function (DUF4424)